MEKNVYIGKAMQHGIQRNGSPWQSTYWRRITRAILAWATVLTATLAMAQSPLPPTAKQAASAVLVETYDLAADGRLAGTNGVPLVILYSRDDCSWCEKVRREYLGPLARDAEATALIRELHMDRSTALIDFQGRRTTSAEFAREMKIHFAPTVAFHGPNGALLAESIVGFRLADFYGAYLERAITDSRTKLSLRREK